MPELASYVTRREAAQLSGASPAVVNKAIEQRVVSTRSVRRTALIDARDVGVLALFAGLHFGLPVKDKRRLTRWLRSAPAGAELSLSAAVIVRKTEALAETTRSAVRYAELKERFLETNPERQGGEPVIRGTRIPIRGLAKQIEAGESLDVLRREYGYIEETAFEFALQWAKANPRRGRPARPRGDSNDREPDGRRGHIERRQPRRRRQRRREAVDRRVSDAQAGGRRAGAGLRGNVESRTGHADRPRSAAVHGGDGRGLGLRHQRREGLRKLAELEGFHPGLIILPHGKVADQQAWMHSVIDFIEHHAGR